MRVDRSQAMLNPSRHVLKPKDGYHTAKAPAPKGPPVPGGAAAPPEGVLDGSSHWIAPAAGAPPHPFSWDEGSGHWLNPHGNRVGFTPAWLTYHGWVYIGPVE